MGTLEFVLSWAEVQVDWRPLMRLMSEIGVVRDFPGGPVIKTLFFHCRGKGSIPGLGTKIPPVKWRSQIEREREREIKWR